MSNSRPKQQAIVYCKSKNYASGSLEEGTAIDAYITAYEQAEKDFMEKAVKWIHEYRAFNFATEFLANRFIEDFKQAMSE